MFREPAPEKILYIKGKAHKGISNYDTIELNGHKYSIDIDYNDDYSTVSITELIPEDNAAYDKQYQTYTKKKAAFDKELSEWQAQKAIWDKEQAAEQERMEKALYRKLKVKFKDKE